MNQKEFRREGITNDYLSELFGKPISKYRVNPVKKGSLVRAELYEFEIFPKKEEPFKIFAKDFWPGRDVSGELERDNDLDMNEVFFLQFGNEHDLFTPRYFGHMKHEGGDKKERTLLMMEKFDMSLEDKLRDLHVKREKTEDMDEKENIKKESLDYVKRAIDVILYNNNVASENYRTSDPFKGTTVYEYDKETFRKYVNNFIRELVSFKYPGTKESSGWFIEYKFSFMMRELEENIVNKLGSDTKNRDIVNFDPNPGNILLKDKTPGKYDPDKLLAVRENPKEDSTYNLLSVTDNNKIGRGPEAMIAILLSHPSVRMLMDKENINGLKDHAFSQMYKLKTKKISTIDEIDPSERKRFDEEFASALRYSHLRNIKFVAGLNNSLAEKAKDFQKRNPLYNSKNFINSNIDYFCEIDQDKKYFEVTNRALDALKL